MDDGPVHVTRDDIFAFLADLSSPVGPEVFAGFGGEIPRLRHAIHEAAPDVMTGVLEAADRVEAIKARWVESVDPDPVLQTLLGIATDPPGEDFINDFYGRFRERWDFHLTDLIVEVVKRCDDDRVEHLSSLIGHPRAGSLIGEVFRWLNEEAD